MRASLFGDWWAGGVCVAGFRGWFLLSLFAPRDERRFVRAGRIESRATSAEFSLVFPCPLFTKMIQESKEAEQI